MIYFTLCLQYILNASEAAKLFLILLVIDGDCPYSRHDQYLQDETLSLNISCDKKEDGERKGVRKTWATCRAMSVSTIPIDETLFFMTT